MKYFRGTATFMFMFLAILSPAIFPYAVTAAVVETPMTIEIILPTNQKAGVTGYFNLQIKSGKTQTIYIQITNNKSEDIVVSLTPTNAYTQPTGGIFYEAKVDSPETKLLDGSFALAKSISMASEVRIKANQTVKVPIKVTVPNINKGTILGGVLIWEEPAPSKEINEKVEKDIAKFRVTNRTAFAIAIQLDLPEQGLPAFSFGKAGFNPVGPDVFIEMRNDAPMLQRQISGVYKVSNKDGQELFAGKFKPIIMAPKTQINFPMPWNSAVLEPGKYTFSITADVAGKEIIAEESFNISGAAVESYAERSIQPIAKTQAGIPYWVAIAAVVIIAALVIIGGLMFWFIKKRKFGATPKPEPKPVAKVVVKAVAKKAPVAKKAVAKKVAKKK